MISELERRRFLRLVDEMGEELGKRHGWIAEVARRLGIHRSTLLKVLNGERRVTKTHLERAVQSLQLPSSYFQAEDDERHYQRWIASQFVVGDTHAPTVASVARGIAEDGRWRISQTAWSDRDEALATLRRLLETSRRIAVLSAYERARVAVDSPGASGDLLELAARRLVDEIATLAALLAPPRR